MFDKGRENKFMLNPRPKKQTFRLKNFIFTTILIFTILIPNLALAKAGTSPPPYYLMEYNNLSENITRAELATIGVRLYDLEYLVSFEDKHSDFKDVKGWATPYINVANYMGIMKGVGDSQFKPNEPVSYVELLTVLMRYLDYEDGVNFQKYPEDYYSKALEIGLANLYIPHNQKITRRITYDTLDKLQDIPHKSEKPAETKVKEKPNESNYHSKIDIKDIYFNTSIIGSFSGELVGLNDFTKYTVELLSDSGKLYKKETLGKSGKFSISGFDVDIIAKSRGYKYEVYDDRGKLVLKGNL